MTAPEKRSFRIAVPAHVLDHAFEGRAVLPAVEILETLARAVRGRLPDVVLRVMEEALFPRFLVLQPGVDAVEAWCELQPLGGGRVRASLGTTVRSRSGAMGRRVVHGTVVFGGAEAEGDLPPKRAEAPVTGSFPVPADRLYRELVPFGPAYRNARDPVVLWEEGAEARVAAPEEEDPGRHLGSPFPLDAALHVACAWCQRFGGTVALPVGFRRRRVIRPIEPGETCRVRLAATGMEGEVFLFDLEMEDLAGNLREALSGIRMRDVSGGRLRPPDWIRT